MNMQKRKFGVILKKLTSFFQSQIIEYEKSLFLSCGKNVNINYGGIFTHKTITIGSNTFIGAHSVMQSKYGKINIGSNVAIGPYVNIFAGAHDFTTPGIYMAHQSQTDVTQVTVEDDCWIGANVIILSNVTIGKGSIIGAGAIVTHDVPPYSIYTGIPGHSKLQPRFNNEEILLHEKLLQSNRKE